MHSVLTAISALSNAFEARDLDAALACFADAPDIMFAGAKTDDYAFGPDAIADALRGIFARDETYRWTVQTVECADGGAFKIALAEITAYAIRDGRIEPSKQQLSGVVQWDQGRWRWRNLCGVLPCSAAVQEAIRDERRSRSIA